MAKGLGAPAFIGCLHLSHKWMAQHRGFKDEFEHDDYLIDQWNSVVGKKDLVYILGDITMNTPEHYYKLDLLNGRKKVVLGNHDNPRYVPELLKHVEDVSGMISYKGCVLTHCPIHPNEVSFCRLNIHCVDEETEILTKSGWKKYNEIKVGESLYTLNEKGYLEEDSINSIIVNKNYNGDIIEYNNKGTKLIYTDEHRVLHKSAKTGKIIEIKAKDLLEKKSLIYLPCSGIKENQSGLSIKDDLLKLYICLAADGNITKYNSCRLNVNKKRKHEYFKKILDNLNIKYSAGSNKSFKYTLGFHLPKELEDYNIKGLDKKILNCNRNQCKVILEAYQNTDGYKNGKSIILYSSKHSEIEILSNLFTINGFRTNLSSRIGGFKNSGVNYSLAVFDKRFVIKTTPNKFSRKIKVQNYLVWCVTTKNKNFISRRNGETIITGNCHIHHTSKLDDCHARERYGDFSDNFVSTVDKYYNVDAKLLDFKPITLEQMLNERYGE